MQLKLEKKSLFQRKSPDPLQLQIARRLVNSDAWSNVLDQFLFEPNKIRLPAISQAICNLMQRNISESEMECFFLALEDRYISLKNIKIIKESFSIPEDVKIEIKLKNGSEIDLSKTAEPFKSYFSPDLDRPNNFKIILDLGFEEIAKEWLMKIFEVNHFTLEYFQKNIFEIFYYAIKSDFQVSSGMIKTVNSIEEYCEQFFYIQIFLRLVEEDFSYYKISNIWKLIDEDMKVELILEAIDSISNLEKLWSYAICLFPENWQNHEEFIKLFTSFFIKGAENPNRYSDYIYSLANLASDNLGLLYNALDKSYELFPGTFSQLISILLLSLNNNALDMFICEKLFIFFPQLVIDNNVDVIRLLFDKLGDMQIVEMTKWINECDDYFISTEEMGYFILPKLSQENRIKVVVKSILKNIDNFDLVRDLFQKTDENSKNNIKKQCEEYRPNLYNKIWRIYLDKFRVEEFINDIKKSIKYMFGEEYAEEYIKRYDPIIAIDTLLRKNIAGFMAAWIGLDQKSRNQLCGPILYYLFYKLEIEDFNLIDFILHSVSIEQKMLIESEIQFLKKNIISKQAFSYWLEKQASTIFIVNFEPAEICTLTESEHANVALTYKILDSLEEHDQLDKLDMSSEANYASLMSCGNGLLIMPYIIKALFYPLPVALCQLISNDLFLVINCSLEACVTTPQLNRFIANYARSISELLLVSDDNSLLKLHYLSSLMIKVNKNYPQNKARAFAELITNLLTNRSDNPLLEGESRPLQGFFIMRNPLDGKICRSEFEKNLILIYAEMKKLYPQFFESEINVKNQEQEVNTP